MVLSLLVVAITLHFGIGLTWLLALLVGAIVAPTDPVAVIALFQQLGVPDRLRTLVEGESIFNDGTGGAAYELVLAVLLPTLGLAEVSGTTSLLNTPVLAIVGEVLWLIFGGLLLGFAVGLRTGLDQSGAIVRGHLLWRTRGSHRSGADDLRVHTIAGCPGSMVGIPHLQATKAATSPPSSPRLVPGDGAFRTAGGAFARPGTWLARSAHATQPVNGYCLWHHFSDATWPGTDLARASSTLERQTDTRGGREVLADSGLTSPLRHFPSMAE